jgi:hypothetical protein
MDGPGRDRLALARAPFMPQTLENGLVELCGVAVIDGA